MFAGVFTKLQIRTKLIMGFSGALLVVLVIGIVSIWSIFLINSYIDEMANQIQPVKEKIYSIDRGVLQTSELLGFYLLSKDAAYRKAADTELEKSLRLVKELQENTSYNVSSEDQSLLRLVLSDLESLNSYKEVAYKVTRSQEANMPGLKFANKLVEPISYEVFTLLTYSDQIESLTAYQADDIKSLINYWFLIESKLHNYLAFRRSDSIVQLERHLDSSKSILDSYLPNQETSASEELETSQNDSLFIRLFQLQTIFEERLETLVTLHNSDKWRKDTYLINKHIGPLVAKIEANLDILVNLQNQKYSDLFTLLSQVSETTRYILLVLMLSSLLVGGLFSLMLVRLIISKLNNAVLAMKDIGEHGNLNRLMENSGSDEMTLLANGFNTFVSKIKGVIDLVNSSSSNLANEAAMMSKMSDNAKDGVMRQQAEISEVAQAINDMSDIMDEVSADAGLAAGAAKQASEFAINGREVVSVSIESTNNLASDVEVTREAIQKLVSEIDDIGSVLTVIKGITDQTNLLALNAAIEAARAGESGRGFAVVADEVRTLSQRTQHETQGIHAKIERLQAEARSAVAAIEKGKETAQHNVELATSAGDALSSITESVDTITEMSQKIASTVEAQSHNSTSINTNMISISQIAAETADVVINASKSNYELSLMAGQLRGMVEQFLYNEKRSENAAISEETEISDIIMNDAVDDVLF